MFTLLGTDPRQFIIEECSQSQRSHSAAFGMFSRQTRMREGIVAGRRRREYLSQFGRWRGTSARIRWQLFARLSECVELTGYEIRRYTITLGVIASGN